MEASPCLGPGEGTGRLRRPAAAWPGVFVGEPVTSATLRLETRRWHSASVGDAVKKRSVAGSAGRGGGVVQGRAGAPRRTAKTAPAWPGRGDRAPRSA